MAQLKDLLVTGAARFLNGEFVTGVMTTNNINPSSDNSYQLGSSTAKWNNIFATTFTGNLSGTATTAINLAAGGTWVWTNGTTAGPTATLTVGSKNTSVGAIPAATSAISGIVTTGAQTFAGEKTFAGAVNFANATWNKVGDNCQFGDQNIAGCIVLKGLNGATGIQFNPYSGSTVQKISIDGAGTMSITEKVNIAKDLTVGPIYGHGNIWAGSNDGDANDRAIGTWTSAGGIYFYSNGSSSTGGRGIWLSAHGTDTGKNLVYVDTNNNSVFYGSLEGSAAYLRDCDNGANISASYNKAGLGYDNYTWLTAWNGYELRAVNKNQFARAHATSWDFTKAYSSKYDTFDASSPDGGPGGWVNGFVSTHNDYLSAYIVNVHRSADWYVGYGEHASGGTPVNPTWYKLLHSSNYTDYTVTKTGSGASGTWGINVTGNAATATKATQDADGEDIRNRYFKIYNATFRGTSNAVTVNDLAADGPSYGMIYAATDNPRGSAGWVHVLNLAWGKTAASWVGQIALHTNGTSLWYRGTSDAIAGVTWNKVLGSNNYTDYTVTKTGTGASGTWGISITGNASYATSSGNADTLDSYHESSFLRYRDAVSGSGGTSHSNSLWNQIGIRQYNNALPDGMADSATYAYGAVVSLPGTSSRFDLWYNHQTSSNGNGLRYRTGWGDDKKAWATILDSANYNSFAPTKTGTGASGTWGINVTGSAGRSQLLRNYFVDTAGNANSASRPTSANIAATGSGGLIVFQATSSMTTGKPPSDSHIIHMYWDNTGGYDSQLAVQDGTGTIYSRGCNAGTWGAWKTSLDSSNYTSYTVTKTGSGASGTWGINISGNANTATSSNQTGQLNVNNTASLAGCLQYVQTSTQTAGNDLPTANWWHVLKMNHGTGDTYYKRLLAFNFWTHNDIRTAVAAGDGVVGAWKQVWCEGNSVTSAVWNDYAEYRRSAEKEPGRVVMEDKKGVCQKTSKRLQPFAGVVSDTWGFSQGKTSEADTNLAVAGRVLVYPHEDRNTYEPGDCVCADENGTVSVMTREEIVMYPDRIVGTVSEIPEYEIWGGGEDADRKPVKVNGRIWIKVR